MSHELPHPALQPVCFLDDPDYHVWIANQWRHNVGVPDGTLSPADLESWDDLLTDLGGEA